MNIGCFNSKYWIRRKGEPKLVHGYLYTPTEDFAVMMHVHPLGTSKMYALPEGERFSRQLEGHGTVKLRMSGEDDSGGSDMLYYDGDWYYVVSVQKHDRTALAHYNYQFSRIDADASGSTDLDPPKGDLETEPVKEE